MTRAIAIIVLASATAGCNAIQPQVLDVGDDGQEVVSLPNGGALILRRALQQQPDTCWVRSRAFRGFVSMSCNLAETARP